MATTTDLEQTGRDANILHNYLDGEPPLRPANEYGRLGQLILRLIEELGSGTLLQYDGRVDSVSDLPATGQLNHFYLVGPEDSENFDEYFWVEPEDETGHWDRLGSVAIIIDDHLDLNSANPVQNGIITAAINAINLALAATAKQTALAPTLVFATAYADGALVTYAGELYKADSVNGSYIVEGQTTSASKFVKADISTLLGLKANSADLATVATSGSYNDLTNKPILPDTSRYALQSAIAPEFDSTATYSEGDLITFQGELYKYDTNGSPLPLDPIVQAPYTVSRDNKWLAYSGTTNADNDHFISDDVVRLTANSTYVLEIPSEQVDEYISDVYVAFCTYTRPDTEGTRTNYRYNSTRITFTPTANCYLSLTIKKGYESGYKLYGGTTAKFTKVDVDTVLGGKQDALTFDSAPTASSNNPVTSDGIKTALDGKVTEGTGYAVINGTRVYVSSTTPTGTIPENSLGIGF